MPRHIKTGVRLLVFRRVRGTAFVSGRYNAWRLRSPGRPSYEIRLADGIICMSRMIEVSHIGTGLGVLLLAEYTH